MRKFLITLLIACSVNVAFSTTSKSPEQPPTIPPPDESLPCQMQSIGTDANNVVYWNRIIFYDCNTGVQLAYLNVLTHEFVTWCMDEEPAWGCN